MNAVNLPLELAPEALKGVGISIAFPIFASPMIHLLMRIEAMEMLIGGSAIGREEFNIRSGNCAPDEILDRARFRIWNGLGDHAALALDRADHDRLVILPSLFHFGPGVLVL